IDGGEDEAEAPFAPLHHLRDRAVGVLAALDRHELTETIDGIAAERARLELELARQRVGFAEAEQIDRVAHGERAFDRMPSAEAARGVRQARHDLDPRVDRSIDPLHRFVADADTEAHALEDAREKPELPIGLARMHANDAGEERLTTTIDHLLDEV